MRAFALIIPAALASACAGGGHSLPATDTALASLAAPPFGQVWEYRVSGPEAVRPLAISDDGERTRILYAPDQALPAVFGIGPTGDEIAVNGHMRNGVFVIDRVFERLVFRIDRARAVARRAPAPVEGAPVS